MHQKRPVSVLLAPLDWGLGHATRCIPIINELIDQGARVLVAATGPLRRLLEQEFPRLEFLAIPGYKIRYRSGFLLKWALMLRIPAILKQIKREHSWLDKCLLEHSIDLIISDNRYGLYHEKRVCVFITHQLFIRSGLGSLKSENPHRNQAGYKSNWIDRKILQWNYRLISRFSECWVPDQEGIFSLAGKLSHPPVPPPITMKYIGVLSRFKSSDRAVKKNSLLILLSGPEPQREQLEQIIFAQLEGSLWKTVVVRGLPGSNISPPVIDGTEIFNHLPSHQLNELIQSSEFIVARAGYSTIMDLVKMKRNAILIPTPGQTEQEYLGRYLHDKKWMYVKSQKEFVLEKVISEFQQADLIFPETQAYLLKRAVEEILNKI